MPGPTFDLPVGTADPNMSALRRHIRGSTAFPDASTVGMILVSNGDAPPAWQPTGTAPPNAHVLATTTGLGPQHTVSGLTAGQVLRATGAAAAQFMRLGAADVDPGTFPAGTFSMTTLNLQTLIIGTDPTGSEPLRVGGGGRFNGAVTVLTGGITVTGNSTITGTLGGITTLTATTLAGTLSTAAQPNVTSVGTLTGLNISGVIASTSTADAALYFSGGVVDASTFIYGSISGVGKFRIQRDGRISALTFDLHSGTDINAGSSVFSVSNAGLVTGLNLTLTSAASKIVPGATSLSLRNTADSADNLLLTDAGLATFRNTVTISAGGLTVSAGTTAVQALTATTGNFSSDLTLQARLLFTTAASKIVPGATSLSHRNTADSADNLLLSDAGVATLRNDLVVSTLGTFDSTIAGTNLTLTDTWSGTVLAYSTTNSKWRPRLLQLPLVASGVVQAGLLTDGTAISFVDTLPTLSGTPVAPSGTIVVQPIYNGMLVDLTGITALSASQVYIMQYSVNGGAYSATVRVGTGTRFVHALLTQASTYTYKVGIRGASDSSFLAGPAAQNPSGRTEVSAFGLVVASQVSTVNLAALSANLGTVVTGLLQNLATNPTAAIRLDVGSTLPGTATTYLDLAASGAGHLLHHTSLDLNADGSARFFGNVDITQSYSDVQGWWLSMRESTLAHGMTALAPTNLFGALLEHSVSATGGGVTLIGFSGTGTSEGIRLQAYTTTPATGTTGGVIVLEVSKKSGTSSAALAAGDNAVWLSNAATTIALFKANGDTTLGGILRVADGAVGAPSISFTNATTTGLFRIAAVGGFTLATSGVGLLSVTTSGGKNYLQRERAGGAVAVQHLGGVLSAVGDSIVSTSGTTETDLKTYTVKANTLDETYRAIRFEAWGSASGNASTQTIRLYYGGVLVAAVDNGASASFRGWYVRGVVHYTGVNTQEVWMEAAFGFPGNTGGTARVVVDRGLPAVANTNDQILKITGQAGGGSLSQYAFDVWYTP